MAAECASKLFQRESLQRLSPRMCVLMRSVRSTKLASRLATLCPQDVSSPAEKESRRKLIDDLVACKVSEGECASLEAKYKDKSDFLVSLEDVVKIEKAKIRVRDAKKNAADSAPSVDDVLADEAFGALDDVMKEKENAAKKRKESIELKKKENAAKNQKELPSKESLDKESLNKESLNKESTNKESANKESANKESPNKESKNKADQDSAKDEKRGEKIREIQEMENEANKKMADATKLATAAAILANEAKGESKIHCDIGDDGSVYSVRPVDISTVEGGEKGDLSKGQTSQDATSAGGDSGWPNDEEPPEAASYDAKIEAAHKKRVVGLKLASAFATALEAAGGMALGQALSGSISQVSSKMSRLAVAMATGMVTTMWMGTMSAPWIYDGRMEELCKISIVEKRDYCNKENDKALTDCPVASPGVSSTCVKQIAQVTDPATMITLMNPPPVGTGPAPPFVNAPCVTKQGPCQKDAADQFMMGIISEFQEAVKDLVKVTTEVGTAMGEGGAAMGKSAGKMGAAAALIEEQEASGLHVRSKLDTSAHMDPGAALEQFAKSVVDARHAQLEWGSALVDKAQFQLATAKKANDKCAEAKALSALAKAEEVKYMAQQDMNRAKADQASAAEKAAAFAKGVPLEGDRQFKLDIPLGSNEDKFTCIKFDLFGCGCKSLPSYETLSGGDCSDMKNILTEQKKNEFKKSTAMGFQGEGKNAAELYDNFASAAQNEDSGRL